MFLETNLRIIRTKDGSLITQILSLKGHISYPPSYPGKIELVTYW